MSIRAMFGSNDTLRFVEPVSDAARHWWLKVMRAGTPAAIARRATASYTRPGTPLFAAIRHATETQQGMLEIWTGREPLRQHIRIGEQSIEIDPTYFNFDSVFDPIAGGETRARALLRDLLGIARVSGIRAIDIRAERLGRLAWLKYGFLPDRGSWDRIKRDAACTIMERLETLGKDVV
jgi:hypothetical protein